MKDAEARLAAADGDKAALARQCKAAEADAARAAADAARRAAAVQDKLTAAQRAAADADRQRAVLEEDKASWAKQRKAMEADAARVAADGDRRIASLHDKLAQAQRVADDADRQRALLEDDKAAWARQRKAMEADAARAARAAEQLLQESERRARQREGDLDRLRTKLALVAAKEKEAATRQRALLAAWREGSLHLPAAPSGAKAKDGAEGVGGAGALDVIEALDQQREALQRRNDELADQVTDLAAALEGHQAGLGAEAGAEAVREMPGGGAEAVALPGKVPRRAPQPPVSASVPSISFSLHDLDSLDNMGPTQLLDTTHDEEIDRDDGAGEVSVAVTMAMTAEAQEGSGLTRECDAILRGHCAST